MVSSWQNHHHVCTRHITLLLSVEAKGKVFMMNQELTWKLEEHGTKRVIHQRNRPRREWTRPCATAGQNCGGQRYGTVEKDLQFGSILSTKSLLCFCDFNGLFDRQLLAIELSCLACGDWREMYIIDIVEVTEIDMR